MKRSYFQSLENRASENELELVDVLNELAFDARGLIPVITQDSETREVLMLAWMNLEALNQTLKTGFVTYWSRSRQELWVKGATSGHTQELVSISFDCDGDAILCRVNQVGGASHTGREHCFYLQVDRKRNKVRVL